MLSIILMVFPFNPRSTKRVDWPFCDFLCRF